MTPTDSGRDVHDANLLDAAWREVVRRVPAADTSSMRMQFDCHAMYARGKETWNLEPWRPDVTQDEMTKTYCNPGGPE